MFGLSHINRYKQCFFVYPPNLFCVTISHGYAPFFKLVPANWLMSGRSIAFFKLLHPHYNIASS